MNRIASRIALLGLLLALPVALVAAEEDAAELEKVRARVSGLFNEIEPEHVRSSPVDG